MTCPGLSVPGVRRAELFERVSEEVLAGALQGVHHERERAVEVRELGRLILGLDLGVLALQGVHAVEARGDLNRDRHRAHHVGEHVHGVP